MKIIEKNNRSKAKTHFVKICKGCGIAFSSNRSTAIWCADKCKKKNYRMNIRERISQAKIDYVKSKYNL